MREYLIEFEIFEANGGQLRTDNTYPDFAKEGICARMYYGGGEKSLQVGHKFRYPDDLGELCPWLVDSLTGMIRVLEHGGTLSWKYKGSPHEKLIDLDGVTTEFIRYPDPTASEIVIKGTRTALPD
jgi:hypothetical protein